jgi:YVTN family beta-propeller protein
MSKTLILAATLTLVAAACAQQLPLQTVTDIPLPGRASRFDYQSFDPSSGRLYIAHLGDDTVVVFDTVSRKVVGEVRDVKHVHGVLAVPELHRIYASATGSNELAVIDDSTLQITARVPAGEYPDGIAYAAGVKKLFVSDKTGKTVTVIDAATNKPLSTIKMGGPVGNSQYDPTSGRIYSTVHKLNEIVEIDPEQEKITARHPLTDCRDPHGLLIDPANRLAFAACEANAKLVVFDLAAGKQIAAFPVGSDPDVLAFDASLGRLYIACESGFVSIFDEQPAAQGRSNMLTPVASAFYAAKAHSVAADGKTHQIYFPLENVNGQPALRIAQTPGR